MGLSMDQQIFCEGNVFDMPDTGGTLATREWVMEQLLLFFLGHEIPGEITLSDNRSINLNGKTLLFHNNGDPFFKLQATAGNQLIRGDVTNGPDTASVFEVNPNEPT